MAENKTAPTRASVDRYIDARANEGQRTDCRDLIKLLQRLTRRQPVMWGPSIVGFGEYRYTYESGRTGTAPIAGFAIRGRELVVYVDCETKGQRSLLRRLGKHRSGRSCLYFQRLADLDRSILEQLIADSIAEVKRRYG